ncbi:hypothetical protein L9F63_024735, partial [Diploptera punctata]
KKYYPADTRHRSECYKLRTLANATVVCHYKLHTSCVINKLNKFTIAYITYLFDKRYSPSDIGLLEAQDFHFPGDIGEYPEGTDDG